jgi:zinc transport system substrate-binding protein
MKTGTMKIRVAVLAGLLLAAGACGDGKNEQTASGSARVRVVAAFYPLYEAALRVGGDRVEVVNLTPAGTEPHDLELTPRQVDQIEGADLVLYLGGGFQPGVEGVARRSEGDAVDAVEELSLLPGRPDEEAEGNEGHAEPGTDPHLWLDPVLLGGVVGKVIAALSAIDPGGKDAYAANAATYRRELGLLDQEFAHRLTGCARRVIVTSHAAFGYLARRYGLTQDAIAGLSPEAEPDPARLAELTDLVAATGTTTVFTETLVSPKVAETLAREAGVTTATLNPIEGLTARELKAGETYVSVMRDNLEALTRALACP